MKQYLFIVIIIAETQQNFLLPLSFNTSHSFTESNLNRTRKSEVNKQFTDWIKEYLKQYVHVHVPCHAIIEQTAMYKWF